MAFSNGGGGTLTLPSPTNLHTDTGPSVRSLRRTLSRSPSRFHLIRTKSHSSLNSESSNSPVRTPSPCPRPGATIPAQASAASFLSFSASASTNSNDNNFATSVHFPTGAAGSQPPAPTSTGTVSTPHRSGGIKLSLRSTRPKTTSKPLNRARQSPKSPLKRALSTNAGLGNSASLPTAHLARPSTALSEPLLGQENSNSGSVKFNSLALALGISSNTALDRPSRHSMHLDLSGEARLDMLSAVSSPLKRSDTIMNLDQANLGSPVAKRRSLHGISSLGSDFNVFDFASPSPSTSAVASASFDIHDDAGRDHQATATSVSAPSAPIPPPMNTTDVSTSPSASVMTKRASSLRKSTLQQRHDPRSSWGRRQGEKYLALQQQQQQQQEQQQQQQQESTSQGQHQSKRGSNEWLFTAPRVRNKPRASLDQILRPEPRESPFKVRGPLPNPSVHPADRSAIAVAPATHQPHPLSRTLTTSSSGSSLPDDSPTHFPVQLPADRPRPTSLFARSLPLNAHRPMPDPVATPQYKAARPLQSVFASAGLVSKMNRNAEDETIQRDRGKPMIMPDTPCKKQVYPSNTYPPSSGSGGRKQQQRRFFLSGAPETPFNTGAVKPRGASANNAGESVVNFFKLRSSHARTSSILSIDGDAGDSQGAADGFDLPPTPTKSVLAKNLFGSGSKGNATPIAIRDAVSGTASYTPKSAAPKPSLVAIASPACSSSPENMSPKTPREHGASHSMDFAKSMAPPDTRRLSISNPAPKASALLPHANNAATIFPPATPTTDREAFANFVDRRVSITPVHGAAPSDTDAVLGSMFGKVECIGKGEFSQVFRVNTRNASVYGAGSLDYFNRTPSKRPSRDYNEASSPTQTVFAVKKVRLPYFGQKERNAKLREVAALEAVRDRENVLQIFDHWEQNGHLYIQTEYCDEGGLDNFLKKVGEHGRLDDFRIWKILLEVSQGLRYVHDAGFIHLDLKPANILVTYEGHLKIGDFGMATPWPAPKGIEGEGDREYMGPEILQGKYDKPADVFALGLIVLEIACNVFLPDNGPIWVALREGDMSVVPSLTAGEASALARDSAGMPIVADFDSMSQEGHGLTASLDLASTTPVRNGRVDFSKSVFGTPSLFGSLAKKPMGLERPPEFMVNQTSSGSLDSVVAWLISPDPEKRPTVHQILDIDSLQWVYGRRRAPATVFEGNWGPEDEDQIRVSSSELDTEMTDV